MTYFLAGAIILAASVGGWWFSLPGPDGQIKPFARNGLDVWIAVTLTVGLVLGFGAVVVGIFEVAGM